MTRAMQGTAQWPVRVRTAKTGALMVGAFVLLTACAVPLGSVSPSQRTESPSFDVGSLPPPSAFPSITAKERELSGTLVGESVGSCAYLRDPDGKRWAVAYPVGWQVIGGEDPKLVNPAGAVVARLGDPVTVRGEEARPGPAFCAGGTPFQASEVLSPSGSG